jgi:hypothetical protein
LGKLKNVYEIWNNNFEKVKNYIDQHQKRPSRTDKNKDIQNLGSWLSINKTNYTNKDQIMTIDAIYNKWSEILTSDKYSRYFSSNEDKWYHNLEKVKKFIDNNDKRPTRTSKILEIKYLGEWIRTQQGGYKNKNKILKDADIYNCWKEFITSEKYSKYFEKRTKNK